MRVLSIKLSIRKKFWNLFNRKGSLSPSSYIYIEREREIERVREREREIKSEREREREREREKAIRLFEPGMHKMNDREKWRERARDIRDSGTTWWWWWWCKIRKGSFISFFLHSFLFGSSFFFLLLPYSFTVNSSFFFTSQNVFPFFFSFLFFYPLFLYLFPAFYLYLPYLPNPSTRAGYDTKSIFKWSLTGLNSDFSFSETSCLTKAEEPSLPYYLPIAGGRIIGFIPFPRVLVLCEMQSISSWIWTHGTVSIPYDDNHYTTGTSTSIFLYNVPVPKWVVFIHKPDLVICFKSGTNTSLQVNDF